MHWRTVLIIVCVTLVYAVLGGVIFHFIEMPHENEVRQTAKQKLLDFLDERPCLNLSTILDISKLLVKARAAGLQAIPGMSNLTYITNWDITSSIFLSFQVIGSVGYGNAPPKTPGGRAFCMIYALIGIPLLIVAGIGIGYMMINGAERLRKTCIRHAGPKDAAKVHIVRTLIIFAVNLVLLVIIPAGILTVLEKKWTFGEAIYFCLTTVLTIGFGDFVPGSDWSTDMRNLYRLAVGFWLILSLLAFAGLWNSINIAIGSTREMQEPLSPEDDADRPPAYNMTPVQYRTKAFPQNAIAYIPQQAPVPKIFADGALAIFRNSNPYTISRGPLYSVPIAQGQVTQIAVR